MKKEQSTLGIVTFPISEAGVLPLSNLAHILLTLSGEIYLITGGAGYSAFSDNPQVHTCQVEHGAAKAVLARALNYLGTQVKISLKLMSLRKSVDQWLFFISGEGLVLPVLTAKLLGKPAVIVSAGSGVRVARERKDPLARALALLQGITYRLADKIIMYSERLITEHGLQKYKDKISIAQKHFVDFDEFKIATTLSERKDTIGYIGALSWVKGVLNLLKAIQPVLAEKKNLSFFIAGSGELRDVIKAYLETHRLEPKVAFQDWIPHDEVPKYLNELKLVVLPSFSEGLPNIILEAMACGTPVLATAVGAIPDLIRDGETGFIIAENSPESIARDIIRALSYPKLAEIVSNARALVEKEYNYQAAVARYRKILDALLVKG